MAFLCDTEIVQVERGSGRLAVYWMGDEKNPRQFGVAFPGGYFNIARQSLAESLALSNEVLTDAVDAICVGQVREQLLHDAENLREYAKAAEPPGVSRLMVEVAEHIRQIISVEPTK